MRRPQFDPALDIRRISLVTGATPDARRPTVTRDVYC